MEILVNYSNRYKINNGEKLYTVDFKQILDNHVNSPLKEKQQYGGLYCYLNPTKGNKDGGMLDYSGLFFLDIDTKGDNKWISDKIFQNYKTLFEFMPNLIAIRYSYSKGIHAFVYDKDFIGEHEKNEFITRYSTWVAYFVGVVERKLDIKLLDYNNGGGCVVDTHNANPFQFLGLSTSDYHWNEYWTNCVYNSGLTHAMKSKYPSLFKSDRKLDVSPLIGKYYDASGNLSTDFNDHVPHVIDKTVSFHGRSGNSLRADIANCILARTKFNEKDALDMCKWFEGDCKYEIVSWIRTIIGKYNRGEYNAPNHLIKTMNWLFREKGENIAIHDNQYITDVLDLKRIKDKFIYIIANTGTGKTEFIKKMVSKNDNVIAVSPNLAILEGKKGGDGVNTINIEDKVYDNKATVDKTKGVMTTMEQLARMKKEELKGKIIIIDEAHLLESYMSIDSKLDALEKIFMIWDEASQIILMSATPGGEIYVKDFKILKFIKKNNANVIIHPIKLDVKKLKDRKYGTLVPSFKYIIQECMKKKNVILFSNHYRKKWDEAGMRQLVNDGEWGEYNSSVKSVERYNKCYNALKGENGNVMLCDWIFATCFLGVGVEIKFDKNRERIKEGHIALFVDEGFDVKFVEQCLGRFRDMVEETINIHVYLYYTNVDKVNKYNWIKEDEKQERKRYESYYLDSVREIKDENGNKDFKYNILPRRFLGLSMKYNPALEESKGVKKEISEMMGWHVYNEKNPATVEDIIVHINKLPYKSVKVMGEIEANLNPAVRGYDSRETDFYEYMKEMGRGNVCNMLELYDCVELLNGVHGYNIPYKNYKTAMEYIKVLKSIYKRGWNVYKWIQECHGNVSKMKSYYKCLKDYMLLNGEWYEIDNMEDYDLICSEERLKQSGKKAENIFCNEFLKKAMDTNGVECHDKIDVILDEMFKMVVEDAMEDAMEDKVFLYEGMDDETKKCNVAKANGERNMKTYEIATSNLESKYHLKKGMMFKGKNAILQFIEHEIGRKIDINSAVKYWSKHKNVISY